MTHDHDEHDDEFEHDPEILARAAKLAADTAPWARSMAFAVAPMEDSLAAMFGTDDPDEWDEAAHDLLPSSLPFALHVAHVSIMQALADLFETMTGGKESDGVFGHWISAMAALDVGEEPES